ncbi:MAG: GNAT family N-acetyltransferase, partial [Deltaproteobacteria bacterium]|nr:GNAT family N-acetyltransferase [Deltaproteobacteria bacterium]
LHTNPAVTDRDLSDISESYIRPGGVFRIVEVEGEIAGSYGLYPVSVKVCELRKMYLMPVYQGRGIGKMMMDEALALARAKGFEEIVLETNSVLVRATQLYKKYRFEYYEPAHLSDRCDSAMRFRL